MQFFHLSLHFLLIFDRLLNNLESLFLLNGDILSNLITLLVLLFLLILHVNLESLNSACNSQPHGILLFLKFLINREEDDLVIPLSREQVHYLEALLVVLSFGLVMVHWELGIVLLVRLNHLGNEESTSHSKE